MTALLVIGVEGDWAMATDAGERMSAMAASLRKGFIAIRFVTTSKSQFPPFGEVMAEVVTTATAFVRR